MDPLGVVWTKNDHQVIMIKMIMTTLRYELPDNTNLAIVTFNNESRVEHQLASLTRFVSQFGDLCKCQI